MITEANGLNIRLQPDGRSYATDLTTVMTIWQRNIKDRPWVAIDPFGQRTLEGPSFYCLLVLIQNLHRSRHSLMSLAYLM